MATKTDLDKYTTRRELCIELKEFIAKIGNPLDDPNPRVNHQFDDLKVEKIVRPLTTALNHISQIDLFEL